MNKIIAEIVTYNPDVEILKQNILSVKFQVDEVVLYDNASVNLKDFLSFAEDAGCTVILNDKNNGIAEALAFGIRYASEKGAKYVYALDDDTITNSDVIEKLVSEMERDSTLGQIGCGKEIGLYEEFPAITSNNSERVRQIITAGSLIDVEKALEVGNYKEDMFIDWVDVEMCYRLLRNGYGIAVHRGAVMKHALGEVSFRKIFNRKIELLNYSPLRLYYIFRNLYYIYKSYPEIKHSKQEIMRLWIKWPFKAVLLEKNGYSKLQAILKGIKNGKIMVKNGKAITYEQAFDIKSKHLH